MLDHNFLRPSAVYINVVFIGSVWQICIYTNESVENLATNHRNRFINRYDETDNYLSTLG